MSLILLGILCLAVAQALLALLQLFVSAWAWIPLYGSRAYGAFMQPNVLASFIATGLAVALALLILPGFMLAQPSKERWRRLGLSLVLALFSALLVWIQSRTGWLGGIGVTLLFLGYFGRRFPSRCAAAAAAVLVGTLFAWGMLLIGDIGVVAINHEFSNQSRWGMLRDTLAMIGERPIKGWGYGGFEYSFQHFRVNQTPPTAIVETVRHPHNEILLWWGEGGAIALAGMALLLWGGFVVVRQAWQRDRAAFSAGQRSAGLPIALCFALLPMAIHTQLEFPFYLSTLHFAVFLLLLAMADRLGGGVVARRSLVPVTGIVRRGGLPMLALTVAVVAGFSLTGSLAIVQTERFRLEDISPLQEMPALSRQLHQERVTFDRQVNALLRYNRTGDPRLLDQYSQWAQGYLMRRVDKNVYASLISILRHRQQWGAAEKYRRDAVRFFPDDGRFQPLQDYQKETK
ncbi:Wzy polymerase domain-containing protein [Serratia sp. IR-2025]|uniref:PglL family O-oligosaccharyltransferase n=1 Tax=Serratia marcescens TaxID=615 RepID=UPI0038799878